MPEQINHPDHYNQVPSIECLHDRYFYRVPTVYPPGRKMYQYARCRFCDVGYEIVRQETGAAT